MFGMLKGNWLPVISTGELPLEQILRDGVTGAPDVTAIATRREQELTVLVWNYHDDDVKAPGANVLLHVNGLPKKDVRVERYRMDEEHSNSYQAWLKMGSPAKPTVEQQAVLERAGKLEMLGTPEKMIIEGGKLALPFELPRQGVEVVRISWQ
jgi:xylan 1,4-beta-xylosidase